jgi:hypothetical protein
MITLITLGVIAVLSQDLTAIVYVIIFAKLISLYYYWGLVSTDAEQKQVLLSI